MAFQAGSIKISGTMGDLSFYNSVFGWLVRMKGGPSRQQFKTLPAFARARENSSEFTTCARAASAIRQLVITHSGIKDKTLYHRLMTLMRQLANEDLFSPRGQRDPLKGMLSTQGISHLKTFHLTKELSLYKLLETSIFFKKQDNGARLQTESPEQNRPDFSKRKRKMFFLSFRARRPQYNFVTRQASFLPARDTS